MASIIGTARGFGHVGSLFSYLAYSETYFDRHRCGSQAGYIRPRAAIQKNSCVKVRIKMAVNIFDDLALLVPLLARQPDAKDRWGQKMSLREHSSASIGTFFFVTTAVATTPYAIMIEAIMARSSRLCLGQRQLQALSQEV